MKFSHQFTSDSRREFLTTSASGIGGIALQHMLSQNLEANTSIQQINDNRPHFAPKAKNCIFIFMAGAPSQLDLFDYKPKLNELNGQKMNADLLKGRRFAFLQKESAVLMLSPRKFKQRGKSGMWFSDLLPKTATCADDICMVRSMHTDQFNHHPGQLQMQCGEARFGLPSTGSWLNYGLGTENQNLPGYIVLTAGRGSSGGATLWQSGFLPSNYAGVRFRNGSNPLLNLENPQGLPNELQRSGLDALRSLNEMHYKANKDTEILSRIANYELAFRMQSAAPELVDLSKEKTKTLEAYGIDRALPEGGGRGKGNGNAYADFSSNWLLARRMVERGVRFINIIHASWDHHSNLNSELEFNAGMSDQPVAALINDLKDRGLFDETLIVWAGEFGRTPLGENRRGRKANTGRDHHPNAFTVLMAGGGVKGGLTYGSTDEIGWAPEEDPVHVNDFQATLLHLFGLDHERLTYPHGGNERRLTSITRKSRVVHELFA